MESGNEEVQVNREQYDLLMGEYPVIAKVIEQFPETVQQSAFDQLMDALARRDGNASIACETNGQAKDESTGSLPQHPAEMITQDYVVAMKTHVTEYKLLSVSDVEFATYTAYFYTSLAPDEIKVDAISKVQLEEAFTIAGRKPPKNFSDTFNNAKKQKQYLENAGGKGMYRLTVHGRYYVEHVLFKANIS